MGDWRGGEQRQMRIEIWQSKGILISESVEKKRKTCRRNNSFFGGAKSGKEERRREIVWGFVISQLPSCVTKSSRWLGEGREINSLAFFFSFSSRFSPSFGTTEENGLSPSSGSPLIAKNHLPLFLAPPFESEIK